jgi:hypothetical protein
MHAVERRITGEEFRVDRRGLERKRPGTRRN